MEITLYEVAQRYVGIREIAGKKNHPLIQWWGSLCNLDLETPDEVPWCSTSLNGHAWLLRLPRSKSAAARSWLLVGVPVDFRDAQVGFDVVILKRGAGAQPGPEVTSGAPGHVGLFAGWSSPLQPSGSLPKTVLVLGGNQGNAISIAPFPTENILGIRRLNGV